MGDRFELRAGEIAIVPPPPTDAGLTFIGKIHTPWREHSACPRHGSVDGPECEIEVFEPWTPALEGVSKHENLEILYWLDRSRRDIVRQNPRNDGAVCGTFSVRSPLRPNPIGTSLVKLVKMEGSTLFVRGLDCLDGTPLLDIKPDRCRFRPHAAGE